MKQFTFKKGEKATGLARVGSPYPSTNIRLHRKSVGTISPPSHYETENKWSIRLHKASPDDHCDWEWITLKTRFDTESDARAFIERNAEKLIAIGLYSIDNQPDRERILVVIPVDDAIEDSEV